MAIVEETGALEVTRDAAAAEAQRAVDALRRFPANAYSQGLLQLAAQLLAAPQLSHSEGRRVSRNIGV